MTQHNQFMLWLRHRYPNWPVYIYTLSYFCTFILYLAMVWIATTAGMWLAVHFVRLCGERPHQYFHMSAYFLSFWVIVAAQVLCVYMVVKNFFR